MGLPIALGSKSVSTYRLPSPEPLEEFAHDGSGTVLLPYVSATAAKTENRLVCVATDSTYQAVVTINYYDMIREDNGQTEHSVAEVRVQVSLLSEPFSTAYRESVFRFSLPATTKSSSSTLAIRVKPQQSANIFPKTEPQAIFSADQKFLTCLVPTATTSAETIVVVFQLRRPRSTSSLRPGPPLPSYIPASASLSTAIELIPVATNPRVLKDPDQPHHHHQQQHKPFLGASCLCDAQVEAPSTVGTSNGSTNQKSLLLVGCSDGSVLAATYRPVSVLGTIHHQQHQQGESTKRRVTYMDHTRPTTSSRGRLVLLDASGSKAHVFGTQIRHGHGDYDVLIPRQEDTTTSDYGKTEDDSNNVLAITLDKSHTVASTSASSSSSSSFVCAKWVGLHHLALLERSHETCQVQVHSLYPEGKSVVVSSIDYTRASLQETVHTKVSMGQVKKSNDDDDDDKIGDGTMSVSPSTVDSSDLSTQMDYDPTTDCLAISSHVYSRGSAVVFASLWHWRTNTQGFTILLDSLPLQHPNHCHLHHHHHHHRHYHHHVAAPETPRLALFVFARDKRNALKLSHMVTNEITCTIQKDIYPAGILSPPYSRSLQCGGVEKMSPLLLASNSISYPRISKSSCGSDYEMEWAEVPIPVHYRSSFAAPTMATMGSRRGRSAAIASDHGLCTLDVVDETATCSSTRRTHPRWYQFASEAEEKSFRVIAMSWWEGDERQLENADDFLVAVVYVEREKAYFLSCWSKTRLAIGKQLLRNATSRNPTGWGVRLPSGFCPSKLDVLERPFVPYTANDSRRAIVLLSNDSHLTEYHLFQLQLVTRPPNGESYPYEILARSAYRGSIGSDAHLFLGGASYTYELTEDGRQADDFLATLGVVRLYGGGLDVLALSSEGVSHVAQVIEDSLSDQDSRDTEMCTYWLAEVARRGELSVTPDLGAFIWTIHLQSGSFLQWTVPCILDAEDVEVLANSLLPERSTGSTSVHPKSLRLGLICSVGSAPQWMQLSAATAGTEFPVGSFRSSSLDCSLGAAQECHKLHRSLGENFESHNFRPDFLRHEIFCPGSFVVRPPTFLPILFSFLVDSFVDDEVHNDSDIVSRYMKKKLSRGPSFESSMMALQLLSLRLVEKATSSKRHGSTKYSLAMVKELFGLLVQSMRYHVTPLQFSTLFVEVGRQLEPSCFPNLFPLPGPIGQGTKSETLEDLFSLALEEGSVSLAIAALPLFSKYETTISLCTAMFRWCLDRIIQDIQLGHDGFNFSREEGEAVGDMFRYGIKLEDTGTTDFELKSNESLNYEDYEDIEDDSSSEDESRLRSRFTLFCGLSRFFRRGPLLGKEETAIVEAAASFIVDGFEYETITESDYAGSVAVAVDSLCAPTESIASIAAQYLLLAALSNQTKCCWLDASKIATILIGGSCTGFRLASRSAIARIVQKTKISLFDEWMPSEDHGAGGLTKLLVKYISACEEQIDYTQAGRVVDLVLVLLDRVASTDSSSVSRTSGLLLIGIVAGYTAGRITEFLSEDTDSPIMTCYLDAQFELGNKRCE